MVWFGQVGKHRSVYLPKSDGGLALPSLSLMYKKLKVSQAMLLLTSSDKVTEEVSRRLICEEEGNKQAWFQPMLQSREVMAAAPGAQRSVLSRRVKMLVSQEDAIARKAALADLPQQGEMLRDSSPLADSVWTDAVSGLESEEMRFALSAATDTLPHNSNLAKWRRGFVLDHCKLCGQKQTLRHVLNHCPVALDKRRHNPRHDTILSLISDLARSSRGIVDIKSL